VDSRDQVAFKELVTDASQSVQLSRVRQLARYWGTEYDWRKFEARLNALPQFKTRIGRAHSPLRLACCAAISLPILVTACGRDCTEKDET
jgi:hypothetical protein